MTFEAEKREAIEIARDLMYPARIIYKLHRAKTRGELDRIMATARHML